MSQKIEALTNPKCEIPVATPMPDQLREPPTAPEQDGKAMEIPEGAVIPVAAFAQSAERSFLNGQREANAISLGIATECSHPLSKRKTHGGGLSFFGMLLLSLGVFGAIFYFGVDTSILVLGLNASEYNLGFINDRPIGLIVSVVAIGIGLAMTIIAQRQLVTRTKRLKR